MTDAAPATPPAAWVRRFAPAIRSAAGPSAGPPSAGPSAARVLDLAAGGGRHTRYLRELGYRVLALDRDVGKLPPPDAGLEILAADLEDGGPWPLAAQRFDGIVVTNYLHRPLLPHLVASLAPGGLLIYETFQQGNAQFGKPGNPAFLLEPGELLDLASEADLTVLGYFSGYVAHPRPAMIQCLAARKAAA